MVIQDTGFDLTAWFETDVITGPGAFAVTVNSFDEYPEQIIRKLYRELTTPIALPDDFARQLAGRILFQFCDHWCKTVITK
ncbi:MAG: DUF1194 domain-containing protein [Octadecabacter sp.]|nr:DUF1194 domain-containing protein [Octadecabacter sp.]